MTRPTRHTRETLREAAQAEASPAERLNEPGRREDAGKLRYDLLPADALEHLVAVYTDGAAHYGERNWEKGMSWSRCFAPIMRHLWRWWRGEHYDQKSGHPHLAHAAWGCLALLAYELRGAGTDDRPLAGSVKVETGTDQ
jgi:Domain of unknown function (DUF5664)